jgi:hypothetical protein
MGPSVRGVTLDRIERDVRSAEARFGTWLAERCAAPLRELVESITGREVGASQ